MGDVFRCVVASIVGNPETGYGCDYYIDPRTFKTVAAAKHYGLRNLDRSDDFNIGVWRDGRLIELTWMGEPLDEDPAVLARIEQDGYVHFESTGANAPYDGDDQ